MEKNIEIQKIIEHWIETSDSDFKTMNNLYNSKDFHWSLFIGHLVIEKLLKAAILNNTNEHSPFTHDLRRIALLSKLKFSDEYLIWFDTITTFNINTRYDSYKKEFFKKCTSEYTSEWISKISEIRKWIKKKL